MDKLSRWVIPYASDYTGVAASLYDLDGMTVFCDADCCTDHYVLNDEPRWRQSPGLCFSTHLRSTEAVLGSDRALVERVCAYIDEVGRTLPLVAVLGTPVPGILGTDVEGIAAEIEARTGVSALGFATTGFKTYDHGIEIAMKALVERFGPEDAPATAQPHRVNILGATPLDFGDVGNDRDFAALFQSAGWTLGLQMPMGDHGRRHRPGGQRLAEHGRERRRPAHGPLARAALRHAVGRGMPAGPLRWRGEPGDPRGLQGGGRRYAPQRVVERRARRWRPFQVRASPDPGHRRPGGS